MKSFFKVLIVMVSYLAASSMGFSELKTIADGVYLFQERNQYILVVDLRINDVRHVFTQKIEDVSSKFKNKYLWANHTDSEWASFGGEYANNTRFEGKPIMTLFKYLPYGKNIIAISSAAFGGRYPNNWSSGNITFPIKINYELITEGYADPNRTHALYTEEPTDTGQYRTLCIDNENQKASIEAYHDLRLPGIYPDEIVSFSQAVIKGNARSARTSVSAVDSDGDGVKETVLIYASKSDNQEAPYYNLEKFIKKYYPKNEGFDVIQLDGGGSTQLWIKGNNNLGIQSQRKLFNWIVVVRKDSPPTFDGVSLPSEVTMPNKIYFSGYANDDKGLSIITMKVSGPIGEHITGFSDKVRDKSVNLSDYYFDSNSLKYSRKPGFYSIALWIKDTREQVASEQFAVTVKKLPVYRTIPPQGVFTSAGNGLIMKVNINGSSITFTVAKDSNFIGDIPGGIMTIRAGAFYGCVANYDKYYWSYSTLPTSKTFNDLYDYFNSGKKELYAAIGRPIQYCDGYHPIYYSSKLTVIAE